MKTLFCPNCEEEVGIKVEEITEETTVRNKPISLTAKVAVCPQCERKLFDEELESANIDRAFQIYRDKYDLLTPEEIKGIREKYGLSQRAMAKFLGWGEVTINRYENGAVQDEAHNDVLKFIDDPKDMLKLFRDKKGNLPSNMASKLEERINYLMKEDGKAQPDMEAQFEEQSKKILSTPSPGVQRGYKQFDLEKIENMILFFAQQHGAVFQTKMNKLLWYADFLSFALNSTSISGSRYQVFEHGPVPEKFYCIFADLLNRDVIKLDEKVFETEGDEDISGYRIIAKQEFYPDMFSEPELQCLEHVAERFKNCTSTQIKNYSHNEEAYRGTPQNEFITYDLADKISIVEDI